MFYCIISFCYICGTIWVSLIFICVHSFFFQPEFRVFILMTAFFIGKISNCFFFIAWLAVVVKNLPANTEDIRYAGLILGLGWSPGGLHGNPLQYSCLENPMDRGAWWATVHRVAKSQTWLKPLAHACFIIVCPFLFH